jgi:hypothetical protein
MHPSHAPLTCTPHMHPSHAPLTCTGGSILARGAILMAAVHAGGCLSHGLSEQATGCLSTPRDGSCSLSLVCVVLLSLSLSLLCAPCSCVTALHITHRTRHVHLWRCFRWCVRRDDWDALLTSLGLPLVQLPHINPTGGGQRCTPLGRRLSDNSTSSGPPWRMEGREEHRLVADDEGLRPPAHRRELLHRELLHTAHHPGRPTPRPQCPPPIIFTREITAIIEEIDAAMFDEYNYTRRAPPFEL